MKTRAVWFTGGTIVGSTGVLYLLWRVFLFALEKMLADDTVRTSVKTATKEVVADATERVIFGEEPRGRRRGPINYSGMSSRSTHDHR